jgi:hypothetical protein
MDGQWPASAPERAKSAATYDMKRDGAMPYIDALKVTICGVFYFLILIVFVRRWRTF